MLEKLEQFINDFNAGNNEHFAIDTIRIEYSKKYKKERLSSLGKWHKISKNDKKVMSKLTKRLTEDEVTSAYQLEKHNIYYYNSSTPPKYRDATVVIFAMSQYHKQPPPRNIIEKILNILIIGTSKVSINVDICRDFLYKPNIAELSKSYRLTPFITNEGYVTDTSYINNPEITMIEKVVLYNKQLKNKLAFKVWRVEAKILVPNIKLLALPLMEFKNEIVDKLLKREALMVAREL